MMKFLLLFIMVIVLTHKSFGYNSREEILQDTVKQEKKQKSNADSARIYNRLGDVGKDQKNGVPQTDSIGSPTSPSLLNSSVFNSLSMFMSTDGINLNEVESSGTVKARYPTTVGGKPLPRIVNVSPDESEEYDLSPVRPYDSRFEINTLAISNSENKKIITNSLAVMGIVSGQQLAKTRKGYSALNPVSLQEKFNLCPDEPYGKQPVLCFGTAFLIAPDVIITAGHNLKSLPLNMMKFLIGYKVLIETGTANLDFDKNDVYSAIRVLPSDRLAKLDLALIMLDRPVVDASPLVMAKESALSNGTAVYSLGYPLGIPMKYITNASISTIEDPFSYYTTLDTFKGNSGSPVFKRETHEVIGVLIEGGTDLISNGDCQISKICSERDCKGEKVINLTSLSAEIARVIRQHPRSQKKV